MNIKKEIQEFAEKHSRKNRNSPNSYYNANPEKVPEYYNKDNIICQYISTHHSLAYHTTTDESNRVVQ